MKILSKLCLLLFPSLLIAQINPSEREFAIPSSEERLLESIFMRNDQGSYGLGSDQLSIIQYDKDQKALRSYSFNNVDKKVKRIYTIMEWEGILYAFSAKDNRGIRKMQHFVQTIDKNTWKLRGDIKLIRESEYDSRERTFDAFELDLKSHVFEDNFKLSADSSKMVILGDYWYKFNSFNHVRLFVFEKKMNLKYEIKVQLPYEDELFGIQDFLVDNKGNVHILCKSYRVDVQDNRTTYTGVVLKSIYGQGIRIVDRILSSGNEELFDIRLYQDDKGRYNYKSFDKK